MGIDIEVKAATLAAAGLGALAAMVVGAASAQADPDVPSPPSPALVAPAVAADAATPAEGVPHLVSPENLPPGTSMTPVGPRQSNGGSYLRELWHAVQTQEVSGKDALLLLTQRPLNANATPPPGFAANPAQGMPAATPPAPGDPQPPAAVPPSPAIPPPPAG